MSDKYAVDDTDLDAWECDKIAELTTKFRQQREMIVNQAGLIDRLKTRIETLETAPDHLEKSIDKLDCYVARLELRIKEVEDWQRNVECQQAQHERAEAYTAKRAMKQE